MLTGSGEMKITGSSASGRDRTPSHSSGEMMSHEDRFFPSPSVE